MRLADVYGAAVEQRTIWRAARPADAAGHVAYFGVLPVLVAVLPVLLPLPVLIASGWSAGLLAVWLPALPFVIVAAIWTRQVLPAAEDERWLAVSDGRLTESLAGRLDRGAAWAAWSLVLLIPLGYRPLHDGLTRWRFGLTSAEALRAVDRQVTGQVDDLARRNGLCKAFVADDPALTPAAFGGPFASRQAIGKLVVDDRRRAYYVLDRPPGSAPSPLDHLGAADDQWLFERGLVRVPSDADPPAATVWGMPMVKLTPLGDCWCWYQAAAPIRSGGRQQAGGLSAAGPVGLPRR